MSVFAFLAIAALCAAAGAAVLGIFSDERDTPTGRVVVALVAGMIVLHLELSALQFLGVRWTPWSILLLLFLAGVAWWFLPRPVAGSAEPRWGWPEAVALSAIAVFATLAFNLWIVFPDLVFHWGVKGERYALAGGVDWAFLAQPWNWRSHPDYPNLLPELYAATAVLGGWRETAIMGWHVLFLVLVVLAARQGLAGSGVPDGVRHVATGGLAALVTAFAIAHILAGSADWLPALAVLIAWPALVGPPSAKGDLRIALAAALAAASKIEGAPLMGFMVGVSLVRRGLWRRGVDWQAVARTAGLPLLISGLWWWACRHHGLFQPFDTGSLDLTRWREVGGALVAIAVSRGTWGAPLILLALPILLFQRGQRALVAVVCGQLLFCLYIYMSAPLDPAYSVKSSFARLTFHLWPTVAMACVVAVDRLVRRRESCDPSAP
jgi:hypothetical protein